MLSSRFTLVEIMIVTAIIGLLASLALPSFNRARMNSQNASLSADLRTATGAFGMYAIEHGDYPPDVGPGVMPENMAPYLSNMAWLGETPLGGQWDWDRNVFGVRAGVSVFQPTASIEQLLMLDRKIDNGDLATGAFRERNEGYIKVMQE